MKCRLFLCLFFLTIFVCAAHSTYVFFNVPDAPKEGLDKPIYHVTVKDYTLTKGYYWADQANFIHGRHAIYIGLQPRKRRDKFGAVFSVFGKSTRGISDHTS